MTNDSPFFFTTGIENSYPLLKSGVRIDQMDKCNHTSRWREDFELVRELGMDALRYGPAYYRTHVAPNKFEWDSCDEQMEYLRTSGIEVIADLLHFGVPSWMSGVRDPALPFHFAQYARAFARRYPWVRYYTPVNEIFICASFSTLLGWWNECETGEENFVRAVANLCTAHELAVEAILAERPEATIVQSESIEFFHPAGRAASVEAERLNTLKYLPLDLTLGRELVPGMAGLLNRNGATSNELSFFREKRGVGQRWLGLDYYHTCEHTVASTGRRTRAKSPHGFGSLARHYYDRYRVPLFHCETNHVPASATQWLTSQWNDVLALRRSGIPIHGFTWYSLTDQIDWQYQLRIERNDLHPVGLYDLERRIRPVGEAYRTLASEWKGRLNELNIHETIETVATA